MIMYGELDFVQTLSPTMDCLFIFFQHFFVHLQTGRDIGIRGRMKSSQRGWINYAPLWGFGKESLGKNILQVLSPNKCDIFPGLIFQLISWFTRGIKVTAQGPSPLA